jgi:hypothetical protein
MQLASPCENTKVASTTDSINGLLFPVCYFRLGIGSRIRDCGRGFSWAVMFPVYQMAELKLTHYRHFYFALTDRRSTRF